MRNNQYRKFCSRGIILTVVTLPIFYLLYTAIISSRSSIRYIKLTSLHLNGNDIELAVRERKPKRYNKTVVLLHADKSDSSTWDTLGTLNILQEAGYRAIAIDLPGHGYSNRAREPEHPHQRAAWLDAILNGIEATDCVLVAPTSSGLYALPLLVRGNFPLSGFVALATHGSERFGEVEYRLVAIKTLVVYGELDKDFGDALALRLSFIQQNVVQVIDGSSHDCYVEKPAEFNSILLNSLQTFGADNEMH